MSETIPSSLLAREDYAPADTYAIDRVVAPLRRALRWISLALVAVMISVPVWQVVMRELFNLPFIGAEELTRFMLICTVFITLPYVVVSGANIRLDEFLHLFPPRLRRILQVLINLSATVTFAIAALSVAVATLRNLQNATPTLGIPYWIFFSTCLVGFVVASLESALQTYKVLAGLPQFVSFPDEAPPDDMADLEAALVAESDRGAPEARP